MLALMIKFLINLVVYIFLYCMKKAEILWNIILNQNEYKADTIL